MPDTLESLEQIIRDPASPISAKLAAASAVIKADVGESEKAPHKMTRKALNKRLEELR